AEQRLTRAPEQGRQAKISFSRKAAFRPCGFCVGAAIAPPLGPHPSRSPGACLRGHDKSKLRAYPQSGVGPTPRKERRMAIYELDGVKPELAADGLYWVAETAAVIGRVRLHSDVSIWYGSVLRGDNEWIEIGSRSQIQDNATLHTDPGFPLTIGHDCVIG